MSAAVPRLSRRMQLIIIAIATIAVGAVAAGAATLKHFFGAGESRAASGPTTAPAPGTFRPTKEQWAGLKVWPVESYTFRAEQITDGNIAINDDTTTPVFSPYSGRVTRVIAKLGDTVQQGDPLMAVEASEVVQSQNDLVAALATLNTARAQLKLAEANEKRQHDLYLAKSGALKDWLQSQADLASAQNALRSAETARSAARNKLRILGKSPSEISAVENAPNSQQMNPEAIVRAPIGGTVVQRQVGLGQYIASAASGATTNPVYSIGDLSTVWLIANVRETDARLVQIGQAVNVRVLAYPGRVFNAHITWIA
ncbi:MAG: efflux RND transporter periplasmic adaptor subunit, partial [Betaproteobacteria bacterium]|nr:efflux RND transporter periplasmic adaptor subunit [Betaproteobacteria bacterium]